MPVHGHNLTQSWPPLPSSPDTSTTSPHRHGHSSTSSPKIDDNPFSYFITPPSPDRVSSPESTDGDDEEDAFYFEEDWTSAAGIAPPTASESRKGRRPRSLSPFTRPRHGDSAPASTSAPSNPAMPKSTTTRRREQLQKLRQCSNWILRLPTSPLSKPDHSPETPQLSPYQLSPDDTDVPPFPTLLDTGVDYVRPDNNLPEPLIVLIEPRSAGGESRARGRQPVRDDSSQGQQRSTKSQSIRKRVWRAPSQELYSVTEEENEENGQEKATAP